MFAGSNDEVITTEQEHNSSILPWLHQADTLGYKPVYIPLNNEYRVTVENFKKVLNKNTKVVVIVMYQMY